jgi:hypothetical protein
MRTLIIGFVIFLGACSSQPARVDCTAHLRPINAPAPAEAPGSGSKRVPEAADSVSSSALAAGHALEPESRP